MNIIITNRFDIEKAEFNYPHIVISMADDVNLVPYIPKKNCKGILKISVWHIDIKNLENIRFIRLMSTFEYVSGKGEV